MAPGTGRCKLRVFKLFLRQYAYCPEHNSFEAVPAMPAQIPMLLCDALEALQAISQGTLQIPMPYRPLVKVHCSHMPYRPSVKVHCSFMPHRPLVKVPCTYILTQRSQICALFEVQPGSDQAWLSFALLQAMSCSFDDIQYARRTSDASHGHQPLVHTVAQMHKHLNLCM